MRIVKALGFLAVGLIVGFAFASWSGRGSLEHEPGAAADTGTVQRLEALETAIATERRRRMALENQLAALEERVAGAAAAPAAATAAAATDPAPSPDAEPPIAPEALGRFPGPVRERLSNAMRARGSPEDRRALFVDAGFTPDRAQWIVERTEALRMETLQARYEAERSGEPPDPTSLIPAEQRLRDELGDADYERYLDALGRPTSINVNEVLGSSPAAQAGLLPGDEIVGYGGKRVFDMSELNRLTLDGDPGELVALDVVRDGQPVQVYVPRGPIGISGGPRFRTRR